MISDNKFRETSGNRTDKTLKNVLLSTFSGMFGGIPSLAIDKALKDISEDPVKDDLSSLNQKIFSSMEKDCRELGCTFTSDLKTNISALGTATAIVSMMSNTYLLQKVILMINMKKRLM